MVRNHLPAAMQGLAVVPIFAGFDTARGSGRLFQYDITGGRYEESDYASTGSGSLHASTVVKLGWREGARRATERSTWSSGRCQEAADEDSATGGPDLIRGIFPIVATITADGFAGSPTTTWATATATSGAVRRRPGDGGIELSRPPIARRPTLRRRSVS